MMDIQTMNESFELTYLAEWKNRNLFSPDWKYISQVPTLTAADLLALSV